MKQFLRNYWWPILFIIILTIVTVVVWYFAFQKALNIWPKVCFESSCFDLEIVDTDQTRKYGLMNRTHLDKNKWMLFVFEEEKIYPFWMKNTLIPLDMIWIDKSWKIVDIQTAQPCKRDPCPSYIPSWSGLYVLEINAWLSSLLWIEEWSTLQFKKK